MYIYLDNAATTQLDQDVVEAMLPYMTTYWGNPSSLHSYGNKTKSAIEKARKSIATLLGVASSKIFFTSGGTEGNNMVLQGSIDALHIKHVITSPLEHPSVLVPLEQLAKKGRIHLSKVAVDPWGDIQYDHLESLLQQTIAVPTLVSIMHANHEIGTCYDIVHISNLCTAYHAIFHTDMVQTIGSCMFNFEKLPIHFAVGSAHKFHGPKGIGFTYVNHTAITPLILGGMQEMGLRGGTENVAGIVGIAKALEIAHRDMEKNKLKIQSIKKHMITKLTDAICNITFNGHSADLEKSLYTILNVNIPYATQHNMLLYNLDIQGIAASAGSACTSGSNTGSPILAALNQTSFGSLRFSFSKYNTLQEIDHTVKQLTTICKNLSLVH